MGEARFAVVVGRPAPIRAGRQGRRAAATKRPAGACGLAPWLAAAADQCGRSVESPQQAPSFRRSTWGYEFGWTIVPGPIAPVDRPYASMGKRSKACRKRQRPSAFCRDFMAGSSDRAGRLIWRISRVDHSLTRMCSKRAVKRHLTYPECCNEILFFGWHRPIRRQDRNWWRFTWHRRGWTKLIYGSGLHLFRNRIIASGMTVVMPTTGEK